MGIQITDFFNHNKSEMMEEPYIGTCCPVKVLGSSDTILLSCEGVGFI